MPGFGSGSGNMGFEVDKLTWKGFSLRKGISPVNIILPMFHTHLHLHAELSRRTNAGSLEAFRSNNFMVIRAHWLEKNIHFLRFQKVYKVWVANDYWAGQEITDLCLLIVLYRMQGTVVFPCKRNKFRETLVQVDCKKVRDHARPLCHIIQLNGFWWNLVLDVFILRSINLTL